MIDINNKIKVQGDLGEDMGYWFIKLYIPQRNLTQSDFVLNSNINQIFEAKLLFKNTITNKWSLVEIKHKDPFIHKDFIGTGLNKYQADIRKEFYEDTGIDCLLIVFEYTRPNIYFQFLSELEKHRDYTSNGIVIFKYKYFNTIPKSEFFADVKSNIETARENKLNPSISDNFAKYLNVKTMSEFDKDLYKQTEIEKKNYLDKYILIKKNKML